MPAPPLSPPVSGPLCTSRVGRTQMQVPPRRDCFIWAGHPGHTLAEASCRDPLPGEAGSHSGTRGSAWGTGLQVLLRPAPPAPAPCMRPLSSQSPFLPQGAPAGPECGWYSGPPSRPAGTVAGTACRAGAGQWLCSPAPWEGARSGPGPAALSCVVTCAKREGGVHLDSPSACGMALWDGQCGGSGEGGRWPQTLTCVHCIT